MTDYQADPELVATVGRLFERKSTHQAVTEAEETAGRPGKLWQDVAGLGLPLVGVDEAHGGSGGTPLDTLAILQAAGRHAVPLPLAETYLAGWLLAGAGLDVPAGPLTVAPGTSRDTLVLDSGILSGTVCDVPWARHAERIVVLASRGSSPQVVSVSPADCRITPGTDLAGMARDVVEFPAVRAEPADSPAGHRALFLRGALARSAQIAGALDAVFALTHAYTQQRVQFGRPIAAFQAVQRHVVTLAQVAGMTGLAVAQAARASLAGEASFEICAAKLTANQNARLAVRAAHQAHGAIGMTREYRLQQFTRRLNAWQAEFGTERDLSRRVGQAVAGADSFHRVVTGAGTRVEV